MVSKTVVGVSREIKAEKDWHQWAPNEKESNATCSKGAQREIKTTKGRRRWIEGVTDTLRLHSTTA
jgi:hypothetical protein